MKGHLDRHIPAALYARVSSDRQDVDLSVAAQLRALRDYADKSGYLVFREYMAEATSWLDSRSQAKVIEGHRVAGRDPNRDSGPDLDHPQSEPDLRAAPGS